MSHKIKSFSENIFSSFEHKAKINTGNKNDEVLSKEIEEITEKISLKYENITTKPFGCRTMDLNTLREDEVSAESYDWLSAANESADGFLCVSNIINNEGKC